MPLIHSGICLTALFSSIALEHRRLQDEASKIRAEVQALASNEERRSAPSLRPVDFNAPLPSC